MLAFEDRGRTYSSLHTVLYESGSDPWKSTTPKSTWKSSGVLVKDVRSQREVLSVAYMGTPPRRS